MALLTLRRLGDFPDGKQALDVQHVAPPPFTFLQRCFLPKFLKTAPNGCDSATAGLRRHFRIVDLYPY